MHLGRVLRVILVLSLALAALLGAAFGGAALAVLQPELAQSTAGYLAVASKAMARLPQPAEAEGHGRQAAADGYVIDAVLGVDQVVAGQVTVAYTNDSTVDLDRLVFHLPRGIQTVTLEKLDGAQAGGDPTRAGLTYTIPLKGRVAPGNQVTAVLKYSSFLVQGHRRQGISDGGGLWLLNDWYPSLDVFDGENWRTGEPAAAFGDYSFLAAATYKVRLTAPAGLNAYGPYGGRGRVDAAEGSAQTLVFETGPIREFALILTNEHGAVAEVGQARPTLAALYLAGHEPAARGALAAARKAIDTYSELFGPYAGPGFVIVEAPITDFKGVEFPGFILISSAQYEQGSGVESVIAHEVAHQWWYSQVGSDQLLEPWIDESLANYAAALYFEKEYGPAAGRAVLNAGAFALYRSRRAAYPESYVAKPVAAFATAEEYKMMTYGRGALFLQALRETMGDKVFFTFLHDLATGHADGYVTEKTVLDEATAAAGRDLSGLFDLWLHRPDGQLPR
ncbi:MAG: M1 family aminopeptidase [Bacillota bacterium]